MNLHQQRTQCRIMSIRIIVTINELGISTFAVKDEEESKVMEDNTSGLCGIEILYSAFFGT